jgi:hypothetical protein
MRKLFCLFGFLFFFFFGFAAPVEASLLVVKSDGTLQWKVLSAEDEASLSIPRHSSLGIEKAANLAYDTNSTVTLDKSGDSINLAVKSGDKTSNLDVTNWKDNLVEIEEKPEVQKVTIAIKDGKFLLRQKGVVAFTDLPLTINSETSEMSVKTETGDKYLSVLPFDAVQSFLRTKLVNRVDVEKIQILEQNGDLAYRIPGEKVFSFFSLYSYSIPISSYISASTGAVLSIDGPKWLNVINFLFS